MGPVTLQVKRNKTRFIIWSGAFCLMLLTFYLIWPSGIAQAHAGYERSDPAANATLPSGQSPAQVQIWFTEQIELRFSEVSVVDKNGTRVDKSDYHQINNEAKSLVVSLKPNLPDGPYTVIFKNVSAEDGHIVKGSFAFLVGAGELPTGMSNGSPLDLAHQQNSSGNENSNFWSVSLRWLNYLSGAALVGALIYLLLVWRTAIRAARATKRMGPQLQTAYKLGAYRAQQVAIAGLIGLYLGWLGWSIYQAAEFSSQSALQLFGIGAATGGGPQAFGEFLFNSRYGLIWLVRLVLLIVAAILLGIGWKKNGSYSSNSSKIAESSAEKAEGQEEEQQAPAYVAPGLENKAALRALPMEASPTLWWAVAALGAGVLLTTSLNSHAASIVDWSWLAVTGDWLHLLSTAIWIGGLIAMAVGLAVAIPALVPGSGDRTRLLAALIPAFSQVAILSVMVLLVTGTFNAALQLSDISDLFSSAYGISLTVKIALLVPLLLLAAYNLLVVSPRMRIFARSKKAGPKEGAGSIAAGKLGLSFRRSVMAEVALTCLVLVAAAFLTSSAPPKSQASSTVLYFESTQGGLNIQLAISPGTIGQNTFEAQLTTSTGLPVSNARLVELKFAMREMDMGTPQLELKPEGSASGRYQAQGSVLSMAGTWDATLLVQRDGADDIKVPVSLKVK
ncbi:MAG TPA: CopD family protein [Chloroflexia bacterium]|nr:CopD family protein [Chloroflexia bacterium]